jgi:putative membrane protein
MTPKLVIALFTALSFPAVAMAGPGDGAKKTEQQAPRMTSVDQAALQHRHDVNLMEIEMGKMALARGGDAVKKYATALIKDHEKSDKDVLALAKAKGVTLMDHAMPANDIEKAEHEAMKKLMARLGTLEGAAFDREYLLAMVDGHTAEVGKITAQQSKVSDAKVKTLLTKAKPVVERHAEQARALIPPPKEARR